MGCVQGRGLGVRAGLGFRVGRLQWHFTCGFDLGHVRHSLWLPVVAAFAVVGGGGSVSGSCGSCGGLAGCVRGRGLGARALCFGRFAVLGGCWWFLCGLWVLFGLWMALSGLWRGGLVGCVQSRVLGARRLAFRRLSCWETSVTLCLWFRFYT